MAHPPVKEIEDLCASPDPQLRVYGVIQLENYMDEMEHADVERILTRGLKDSDRAVLEQAKRIQASWVAKGPSRFGPEARWPIFRHVPEEVLGRFKRLKESDLEKMRGAAYDLVTPPVLKLHSEAIRQGDALPMDKVIDTLGRLQLPQSLPILGHLGKDAFLAERVVQALGAYQTPESEEYLLQIAEDLASPASLKAVEALGRADHPRSLALLEKCLRDVDARRRRAGATALGYSKEPKAPEWLLSTLVDGSEEVTLAGVQALSRQRVARSADHLVKLSRQSESRKIRATVAMSLARIQSPAAFEHLQMLLEDSDMRVRANALESLAFYQLSQDQASKIYVQCLRSDVPRIRGNAVLGLFKFRPSQALESLGQMFKSPDRMMRRAAAFCSSQIQTHDTANWVTTMVLTEQNPEVLKAGMNALQKFSRRDSVDVFTRMTTHPRIEVRILAMHLLGAIGGPTQIVGLTQLFRKETAPKVRAAIVTALAKLGGTSSLSILPTYLHDADDRVVANAIEGLHDVNNIEAVTSLKPMIHHRARRVRANVVVSLFSLGEVKIVAELSKFLEARDPKDQAAGLWALGAIGEDLRLGSLDERFLLCMALSDYHKKSLDSSAVSGAQLMASVMDLRPAAPPVPKHEPPPLPEEPEPDQGEDSSGIPDEQPEEAEPEEAAEAAEETPPPPPPAVSAGPPAEDVFDWAAPTEEQTLCWEKFIDLSTRDPALAAESLAHYVREVPSDEIALFLYLRVLKDTDSPAFRDAACEAAAKATDYLSLLYFLARELKELGEIDRSLSLYLSVFRRQHQELGQLARLAQVVEREESPELATTVLKLLSSFSGLVADLHRELGHFFLQERFLEYAFHHLIKARVVDPTDTQVSLKLAYICRKLCYYKLGRVLCRSMLSTLPEGHADYSRAVRILHDIKNKEERDRDGAA